MSNTRNFALVERLATEAGIDFMHDGSRIQLAKGNKKGDVWNVAYWTQGDVQMLEDAIEQYMAGEMPLHMLLNFEYSMATSEGGYVVDSYRLGSESMKAIINDCFQQRSISASYSAGLIAEAVNIDFDCTSARLVHGRYITPCMIETCVKQVIDSLSKEQKETLAILLGVDDKVKNLIASVTNDTWKNIGISNDFLALEFLDLVRGV